MVVARESSDNIFLSIVKADFSDFVHEFLAQYLIATMGLPHDEVFPLTTRYHRSSGR